MLRMDCLGLARTFVGSTCENSSSNLKVLAERKLQLNSTHCYCNCLLCRKSPVSILSQKPQTWKSGQFLGQLQSYHLMTLANLHLVVQQASSRLETSSYPLLGYRYDETIQASTGILAISMGFLMERLSYTDLTYLNLACLFPSKATF